MALRPTQSDSYRRRWFGSTLVTHHKNVWASPRALNMGDFWRLAFGTRRRFVHINVWKPWRRS